MSQHGLPARNVGSSVEITMRRVAIVHPWANFDATPNLRGAALLLAEHGYFVDILTDVGPEFTTPVFDSPRIAVRISRSTARLQELACSHASARARLRTLGPLFVVLRGCYRAMLRWLFFLSNFAGMWPLYYRARYRCFIGVDPEGLAQARALARLFRVPFAYYSLELLLSRELTTAAHRALKRRERLASREAAFVIIQDEERARLLAADNNLPRDKFVLVPNAPLGPARRQATRYWHRRFTLPSDRRVVLHAGNIARWTAIEDIVASATSWPDKWILVVHTRFSVASHSSRALKEAVDRLQALAVPGRVFLSLTAVPAHQLDALFDGADIGIAFYVPTDESPLTGQNVEALGLSSGKIAHYLRAGLPVIVNDTTSITKLVGRQGCGVAVGKAGEIGGAIAHIAEDYEAYSRRACRAFAEYFDFSAGFQAVIQRIDSLGGAHHGKP